jgi:tRNA-2-methylthio-N6-dimethylallyladenosine synthase
VKEVIPDCAITTDIISGFCGETEKDHEDTVSLMNIVGYEQAFMFAYSERDGTAAARHIYIYIFISVYCYFFYYYI